MVILTPEGGEAEGLGVVRSRARVTGAELGLDNEPQQQAWESEG